MLPGTRGYNWTNLIFYNINIYCRPLSTWWARRRPPVFASLFLTTRRFGLICMSHVIRLDAKQSAKGCATCTWLEGATTCGVIQCYPMASGVESQGGPWGSTTHAPPPYRPTPPPPTKNSNYFVCVCRYSIVTINFFRWAPLIKILDPPLTSYPKKKKKKSSLARAPTTGPGPGALAR